jgi:hypothetical protein
LNITEEAKDSSCLIEYWSWNLHLAPVDSYDFSQVVKHLYSNRWVHNTGNTNINMLIDEIGYPLFFVKMETDSSYFRMIFDGYIHAEDSSELYGEVRLNDLESVIYNSALDNRFKYYNKRGFPFDTLVLIHTHFANKVYRRILDYSDSVLFVNVHKYDSISLSQIIENNFEKLFSFYYQDTHTLKINHYHFLKDYIKTDLKLGYDFDINKVSDRQKILEITLADLKQKILNGYKEGLKSFEDFKNAHENALHEYSIFYSLPDFKFYIAPQKLKANC